MKRAVLALLLAASPATTQEVITLPEAKPVVFTGSQLEPGRTKGIDTFEVSVASEWMQLSVPFGPTGNTPYAPTAPSLGVRLDSHGWHVDFVGQLLEHSIRQRRIATTLMNTFARPGPFAVGMQIDYWELSFRRRVASVQETGVETYRQGRTIMGGPFLQYRAPRSILLGFSVTGGWYANQYDSYIVTDLATLSEPLVRDETGIGKAQVGIQTGLIANRVRLAGSVRYLRVFGGHSSWTPLDEWSGDGRFDIRLITRRGKSIFIGAYLRFGPPTPGLVSDKTFGLRGTMKLR